MSKSQPREAGSTPPRCKHCDKRKAIRPRGLCERCFCTPGVREHYPVSEHWSVRKGYGPQEMADDVVKAELELLGALVACPSSLDYAEWVGVLRVFTPRLRRVVVMRGMMGLQFDVVGERLGVSRARAQQFWDQAALKLGRVAEALGGEEVAEPAGRAM